jgi:hypothetical protein
MHTAATKALQATALTAIAVACFALALYAFSSVNVVRIESEESKTTNGEPVYNRIALIQKGDKEIWMMNQSHLGPNAANAQLERLAIVVDKSKSPKTARFYQLQPGPLEWNDDLPKTSRVSYRVSCFLCHANGPRAIRPTESENAILSFGEKLSIGVWNLKIKTYGRILEDTAHAKEDETLETPFHPRGRYENEKLTVGVCVKCHQEGGLVARGALTRLQTMTMKTMVQNGHMPPPGFSISPDERAELESFFEGF